MSQLHHIETFVEVASQLSFAAAARRLGLPPSTVTTRVRTLEDTLGVRLLERSTRNVALTSEGAIYLESCRNALEELEAGRDRVSAAGSQSGTVRLSVPAAFPMPHLADMCSRFLQAHPKISLDISVDDQPVDFVRDQMDLALRGNHPGGDDTIARLLSQTPVILAAPKGRLADDSLPVLGPLARHLPQPPRPGTARCDSFALALELTLAGLARACLPRPMCQGFGLDLGRVPQGVPSELDLYLVYHDRRHLPRRVRLFMDFLIEEYTLNTNPGR